MKNEKSIKNPAKFFRHVKYLIMRKVTPKLHHTTQLIMRVTNETTIQITQT